MRTGVIRHGLAVVVGALALVSMNVNAQAPGGARGPGPGMGAGMGMGAADRPTTIERMRLNDASLNLTAAQKTQIDKIVDDYVAEQRTLNEKYPMAQGSPPSQEAMTARNASRDKMNAAVGKVLDEKQRAALTAAQAAARPQGGPGGPGAGPGGPGGAGGPGRGGPPPAGR